MQDPRCAEKDTGEKGFYISFDDDQPKRPKPPLRAKQRSPKKEKSTDNVDYLPADKSETNFIGNEHETKSPRYKVHTLNNSQQQQQQPSSSHKENLDINKSTYNKYTDSPIQLSQVLCAGESSNKKHNEPLRTSKSQDSQHSPQTPPPSVASSSPPAHSNASTAFANRESAKSKALVIGTDVTALDPVNIFLLINFFNILHV